MSADLQESVADEMLSAEEAAVASLLDERDGELAGNFRRLLPRARAGILHRLLQCCVRENIGGFRERMAHDLATNQLVVRFDGDMLLAAPVARRLSLDRWDFAPPITIRRGKVQRELQTAVELLDLLNEALPPADGRQTAWRARFRFELDNSTANYALALAGAERRRCAFVRIANESSVLDWADERASRDQSFSPLVFFEQWVVDGHPLHPGAKLKAGMLPADVMRYSPEWEARPDVRIVAAAKSHCRVATFKSDGPSNVLRREYPALGSIVDHALRRRGLDPDDYEWIPVHPWQFERTIPDFYVDEIRRRTIVPLPEAILPTAALMAVRSLAPIGDGSRHRHHLKTAVNVQMTGAVRTVSPQAAANGPMLASVLTELQLRERRFDDRLVVLLEDVGVCFDPQGHDLSEERRAQLGKNLAAVLRENSEAYVRPGEIAMPASALLAESPLRGGPIVAESVARYARRLRCAPNAAVVAMLKDYAAVTVPGILTLMTRYGVGLEAHLQNCVLVFRDGWPVRMLVRDMGGVRILPSRLERHGVAVRLLPGSATLALDDDDLRHKVGYAFLQNHWGELIACLVRNYDVAERDCWQPLAEACKAEFRRLADDPFTTADARADAADFFRSHLALKALTTMRLLGDVTKYSFSEVANPLAEFAEVEEPVS